MNRILLTLALVLSAVTANAQWSALRRSTNAVGTDLLGVETNAAGLAGQRHMTGMTISNFLNVLIGLDNWPVTGGVATNAISTLKTNGVSVTTAATTLNLIAGTNVVLNVTNTAGVVDVRINAAGGSGEVSTAQLLAASNALHGAKIENLNGSGTNLILRSSTISTIPLKIQAAAGQDADLFSVLDSASNTLFGLTYEGNLTGAGGNSARLAASATVGHVWTATGADGSGAFQAAAESGQPPSTTLTNLSATGAITNISEGNKVYVRTNGNDATAVIGRMDKPYATIAAGMSNVVSDGGMEIGPGVYTLTGYRPLAAGGYFDTTNTPVLLNSKSNVVISAPYGASLTSTTDGILMAFKDVRNIRIEGLNIRAFRTNNSYAYSATYLNHGTLDFVGTNENVTIQNCHLSGGNVFGISASVVNAVRTFGMTVKDCSFSYVGYTNMVGGFVDGGVGQFDVGLTFLNNTVYRCSRGVETYQEHGNGVNFDTLIAGNSFYGVFGPGIFFGHSGGPSYGVRILDNYYSHDANFYDYVSQGSPILLGEAQGVIISGNIFTNIMSANGTIEIHSEDDRALEDIKISGNMFLAVSYGIEGFNTASETVKKKNITIQDNFFRYVTNRAILVEGNDWKIQNNTFVDCGMASGQKVIWSYNGANPTTNLLIEGNSFYHQSNSFDHTVIQLDSGTHRTRIANNYTDHEALQAERTFLVDNGAGTTVSWPTKFVNATLVAGTYTNLMTDTRVSIPVGTVRTNKLSTPFRGHRVTVEDGGGIAGSTNIWIVATSGVINGGPSLTNLNQDGASMTFEGDGANWRIISHSGGGVSWNSLVNVPAGFADGTDDGAGGSVATDAIWDAAGDLVYGTGANTGSRLAVGTAGQFIQVNAGATAPQWSSFSGDITVATGGAATIAANSVALGTDTTGNYAAGDGEAGNASTVVVVDGTDATSFIGIFDSATGGLAAKTDGALLYDASNGTVSTPTVAASTAVNTAALVVTNGATLNGTLTINRDMVIPWESAVATNIIYATNGPRQMMTLSANTNVSFSALAGSDASNSVATVVAVKQNATGGFTFSVNGRQLPVNTATGAVTDVVFYFSDGRTNFVADLPFDLGTPSAGQVLSFHNAGLITNSTAGAGTVTSVAATVPGGFSISGSPITSSGTLAISASGTSGGVPYYSGASTMASSAALAANSVVIGGGAGAAPATTTTAAGVVTFIGTPSSANLATAVTDETGSGALVFGTSPVISGGSMIGTTTIATPVITNAVAYVNQTVSGVGGALTNFTGLWTHGKAYIDGGTTNVNFVAFMPGTDGLTYYLSYSISNLTTTARNISFSSVTNRIQNLQQYYGISPPYVLTNKHTGELQVELNSTNAKISFIQYTNGF